jgi:two-component system CheB/CheR fusion protein
MTEDQEQFEGLIRFMRDARGFDFAGYKRSTLMRRTVKRMREVGMTSFEDYRKHLESSPEEFVMLFNTILINVPSFFRDRDAWRVIGDELVPKLIEESDGPIRIWSAGCATGQEPFSVAMLFAAPTATSRSPSGSRSTRPTSTTRRWPRRGAVCTACGSSRTFPTIFASSASRQTAPGTRCASSCGAQSQGHRLPGAREVRDDADPQRSLHPGRAQAADFPAAVKRQRYHPGFRMPQDHPPESSALPLAALQTRAFALSELPQVLVDLDRRVWAVNVRAKEAFGLSDADVGRPLQDLELSYRPAELRSPWTPSSPIVLRSSCTTSSGSAPTRPPTGM